MRGMSSRTWRAIGVAAASFALAVGIASPSTAEPTVAPPPQIQSDTEEGALARTFGLTIKQARARIAAEKAAGRAADRLNRELGTARSGGAYLQGASGKLVVTVTDSAASASVIGSGATPRLVRFSAQELNQVGADLDTQARGHGAGKVQSWYVDVAANAVIVDTVADASDTQTEQFLSQVRRHGDKVVIRSTAAKATLAASLYGGQQVNMSDGFVCSAGFNARTSAGARILLTAGHCAESRPTFSRNGVIIGTTRAFSFPGNDYAAVNVSTAWTQQGAVDMYNGTFRRVSGFSRAPVGSSVCKSGRTTGWTCGVIQANNQTVNYGNGDIVSGLVRHSACVEQGDSGGSNISSTLAQGLTSGGALYTGSTGRLVCGQKVGQQNVSFYQPVGEALSAYGATLITS
ncbi:MAG TPA: S1 family peptidase [Propionibacteriaceae bacterium]|nr:S1 family peptidase [Propionibacteriaceae bacterium]